MHLQPLKTGTNLISALAQGVVYEGPVYNESGSKRLAIDSDTGVWTIYEEGRPPRALSWWSDEVNEFTHVEGAA